MRLIETGFVPTGEEGERWNTRPIEDALLARLAAAEAVCKYMDKNCVLIFNPGLIELFAAWRKAQEER